MSASDGFGRVIPLEKSSSNNGWSVFYIGQSIRAYSARIPVNVTVTQGQRSNGIPFQLPPDTTFEGLRLIATYEGNFGGHALVGLQGGYIFIGNQYSGGSLTFSGNVNLFGMAI